jgi:hypothetical protein
MRGRTAAKVVEPASRSLSPIYCVEKVENVDLRKF